MVAVSTVVIADRSVGSVDRSVTVDRLVAVRRSVGRTDPVRRSVGRSVVGQSVGRRSVGQSQCVYSKPKYCDFEVGVTRIYGFETPITSSGEHTEHTYQVWCAHEITQSDPAYATLRGRLQGWAKRSN